MNFDESALQQVHQSRSRIDQYHTWLFGLIEAFIGQRLLEVDCGLGNLVGHLLDRELVVGIDVSAACVAHVKSTCGHHPNVRAVTCDLPSPAFLSLKSHRFDTPVSLNVLKHIEDDVLALQPISEVLVPSGRLILIVPAHPSLYGTMNRSIGPFRRYSHRELADKLRQAGFEVRTQRYVNAIGALGWILNSRIPRREARPMAPAEALQQTDAPGYDLRT